jgi:hypothetical protein
VFANLLGLVVLSVYSPPARNATPTSTYSSFSVSISGSLFYYNMAHPPTTHEEANWAVDRATGLPEV